MMLIARQGLDALRAFKAIEQATPLYPV